MILGILFHPWLQYVFPIIPYNSYSWAGVFGSLYLVTLSSCMLSPMPYSAIRAQVL